MSVLVPWRTAPRGNPRPWLRMVEPLPYREIMATPATPRIGEGMQNAMASVPLTIGTCEEFGCEWFLFGKEGIDEGAPFSHPAGVECGDFLRCTDPNCPCPQRVILWQNKTRRGHWIPSRDPSRARLAIGTSMGTRTVDIDEWVYRLHEGTDAIAHIRTRGL